MRQESFQPPVQQPPGEPYPGGRTFFHRRLSSTYYLGRHLTIGLLLSLLALGLLAFIAANVEDNNLAQLDTAIDQFLYHHVSPGADLFFWTMSQLGSRWAMIVLAAIAATVLATRGYRMLAVAVVIVILVGGSLDQGLKGVFQVARPPSPQHKVNEATFGFWVPAAKDVSLGVLASVATLALFLRGQRWLGLGILLLALVGGVFDRQLDRIAFDPWPEKWDVFGFPSGHAMGSIIGYGLLAYLLVVFQLRRRWTQIAVVGSLTVLVLLIGLSRMYLHAHYFSQVMGGYAAGGAWLVVWITGIEILRRRSLARQAHGPGRGDERDLGSGSNSPTPESGS